MPAATERLALELPRPEGVPALTVSIPESGNRQGASFLERPAPPGTKDTDASDRVASSVDARSEDSFSSAYDASFPT